MSQTKVWSCDHSTVIRVATSGATHYGCGGNKRLYVGRRGSYDYWAYLHFALNWTDVGSIVSAILTLTTDDGQGVMPLASTSDVPKITVYDLDDSFTEGDNVDETFNASDYTSGAPRYNGTGRTPTMTKAANSVTNIDITAMVRLWAPSAVTGGGRKTHYGLRLKGSTSLAAAWSGWSRHASTAGYRPYITLTYELGPTTPYTPTTGLAPVGDVTSIGAFQGDFDDPRPADVLARTDVQVYANASVKSGTASASTNYITSTSHGFINGQEVWFHILTGGAGLSLATRYYVRDKTTSTFKVATSLGGPAVDITTNYSALTVGSPLWSTSKVASDTERVNALSNVVPGDLTIRTDVTYQWRMRQQDQESRWSAWSALTAFSVTNTDPDPPSLFAIDATDSLIGVVFRSGVFSDDDVGDTLLAYQVQLANLPDDDPGWDEPANILWDTGKMYVPSGSDSWETLYGGRPLTAATYHWRARVWDNNDGVSDWTYETVTLTADFDPEPGSQPRIQYDPNAPWRIRIREMAYNSLASKTGAVTGVATTNLFTSVKNHGMAAGYRVRFSSITGGTGLYTDRTYYVIASGLTATAFRLSETDGGDTVDFTTDVSAAVLTGITTRGPGATVAVIPDANSVGASLLFNSPGEMHFTLPVDHPQISVIEPKQTHYGIDFYSGDGWRETFAGLVDDMDATEVDCIFLGLDYLGLLDLVMDERYYPADPNRSYSKGGSFYANVSIRNIVIDQLNRATKLANSPVGFISVGTIETMSEMVTIYSTMQPVLALVGGLLNSHSQGKDRRTRIWVQRTSAGAYQFRVQDNSGTDRDNLRMVYGELVQGYRIIPFGRTWASVLHAIGRTREGIRVLYKTKSAPGIDQRRWGRFARAVIMDNVSDENDLDRRAIQGAIAAGKLGRNIAIALRSGVLRPFDGYTICDAFPVAIRHGAVNTDNYGSGYWVCLGVTWDAGDDASQVTTLTLAPREDTTNPADDLIDTAPISPQAEWQKGWVPPDPLSATSTFWVDEATGIVYVRYDEDEGIPITGTA